jgi:hypothetical protein
MMILGGSRRDDDLALHFRMRAAEIAVRSGFGEGERETVAGIERLRMELTLGSNDDMRNVVLLRKTTVVPAFTVNSFGVKVKLSMFTSMSAARAGSGEMAPRVAAINNAQDRRPAPLRRVALNFSM